MLMLIYICQAVLRFQFPKKIFARQCLFGRLRLFAGGLWSFARSLRSLSGSLWSFADGLGLSLLVSGGFQSFSVLVTTLHMYRRLISLKEIIQS